MVFIWKVSSSVQEVAWHQAVTKSQPDLIFCYTYPCLGLKELIIKLYLKIFDMTITYSREQSFYQFI